MFASLASVSISVTNVLAVEASERMVHRRCHRALVARMPEALAATLRPYRVTVIAKVISLKYHEPVHNRADLPRAGTHVFAPELQVAL